MRDLLFNEITRAIKCCTDEAKCLVLNNIGFENFGREALPSLSYLDLSENCLQSLEGIFENFPSVWWINLSNNKIANMKVSQYPLCIGSLDISGNNIQLDELQCLQPVYILRINIIENNPSINLNNISIRQRVIEYLPLTWVINGDYVPNMSKQRARTAPKAMSTLKIKIDDDDDEDMDLRRRKWAEPQSPSETLPETILAQHKASSLISNGANAIEPWKEIHSIDERQGNLLNAIQCFPKTPERFNCARLEILLEDYNDEVCIYNKHLVTQGFSGKPKPYVDCVHIMKLPHKIRVDLAVLLTASIVFETQLPIMRDAYILLLHPFMPVAAAGGIYDTPQFVKTALISIIHRICAQEQVEFKKYGRLLVKPVHARPIVFMDTHPIPKYCDASGFLHLCPFREYVDVALGIQSPYALEPTFIDDEFYNSPFSELELELLSSIPQYPTRFVTPLHRTSSNMPSYNDWTSLVARHTVLLIMKCPGCPSLTKAQTCKTDQNTYSKLLPLLKVAGMRYEDLELHFVGAGLDGRLRMTGSAKKNALIGGNVMAFGAGLPSCGPENLSWNVTGPMRRKYSKPWREEAHPTDFNDNDDDDVSISSDGMNSAHADGVIEDILQRGSTPPSPGKYRGKNSSPPACFDVEFAFTHVTGVARQGNVNDGARQTNEHGQFRSSVEESHERRSPQARKAHTVGGFSADSHWDTTFLLAPVAAVSYFNKSQKDAEKQWSEIEYPPLVLTASEETSGVEVVPFTKSPLRRNISAPLYAIAEEGQASLNGEEALDRVTNMTNTFSKDSPCLEEGTSMTTGSISWDNISFSSGFIPRPRSKRQTLRRSPSSESDSQLTQYDLALSPMKAMAPDSMSSSLSKLDLEEKKLQLLIEMGTLKNTRRLDHYNRAMRRQNKASKSAVKEGDDDEGQQFVSAPTLSWKNLLHSSQKALGKGHGHGIDAMHSGQDAFITEVDSESDSVSVLKPDSELDFPLLSSDLAAVQLSTESPPLYTQRPVEYKVLSATSTLRERLNYAKIYTNRDDVEVGEKSLNGRVMQPTWYPQYKKKMMIIDGRIAKPGVSTTTASKLARSDGSVSRFPPIGNKKSKGHEEVRDRDIGQERNIKLLQLDDSISSSILRVGSSPTELLVDGRPVGTSEALVKASVAPLSAPLVSAPPLRTMAPVTVFTSKFPAPTTPVTPSSNTRTFMEAKRKPVDKSSGGKLANAVTPARVIKQRRKCTQKSVPSVTLGLSIASVGVHGPEEKGINPRPKADPFLAKLDKSYLIADQVDNGARSVSSGKVSSSSSLSPASRKSKDAEESELALMWWNGQRSGSPGADPSSPVEPRLSVSDMSSASGGASLQEFLDDDIDDEEVKDFFPTTLSSVALPAIRAKFSKLGSSDKKLDADNMFSGSLSNRFGGLSSPENSENGIRQVVDGSSEFLHIQRSDDSQHITISNVIPE